MIPKNKRMKVLLINPPITVDENDYMDDGIAPPLGLGYLGAYLIKGGHEVKILDCLAAGFDNLAQVGNKIRYGLDEKEIIEAIKAFGPDVVGVTSMFTSRRNDAHSIARLVKYINKDMLVVFGGCHASSCSSDVLADGNVDAVVRGEGEETMLEIVNNIAAGKSIAEIKGAVIRANGSIRINESRPFIKDLDSIPFPSRDLFSMDLYFKNQKKGTYYNMRAPFTTVITSRGCPGQCVFCSIKNVWGNKWRARSPKNVADEIEFLIRAYNIREIIFLDDNISADRNRMKEICNEIIERKLDIKWTTPNGIALWTLDEELLKIMKKAGCFKLTFGLESGSSKTLKFINKNYSYEHADNIIKFANRLGIITLGTFIIGFPYETSKDIEDTIKYAVKSELDFAFFYTAATFPGTKLYEITKNENLAYNIDSSEVYGGATSKYFTSEQLNKYRHEAGIKFTRSRIGKMHKYILKIRSLEDFNYLVKLGMSFFRVIKKGGKDIVSTTALIREKRQ